MYNKQPIVDDLEFILTRPMSATKTLRTYSSSLPSIQEQSSSNQYRGRSSSPAPEDDDDEMKQQRQSSSTSFHRGKYRFDDEEVSLARRLRRIQRRKMFEHIEDHRQQQQARRLVI